MIMAAQGKADEDIGVRRRRLRYRAWHRGTKEMDLVLGPFADAHLDLFETAELERLEVLMEHEDTDLLAWVLGQTVPPSGVDIDLLCRLVEFRQLQPRQ